MAELETAVDTQQSQTEAQTELASSNPFDESSWVEQTVNTEQEQPKAETKQSQAATEANTQSQSDDEIIDDHVYLKQQAGYDNWDSLKNDLAELKKLREKGDAGELKFANEASKKYFDAITSGKEDELYNYLNNKRTLSGAKDLGAKEAIALHIQQANQHYTAQDVQDIMEEKYPVPEKPLQSDDELDEEYNARVGRWQSEVDRVNRKIERDGFTAKQELQKISEQQQLLIPEIPKQQSEQPQGVNPEELEKIRSVYRQSLDAGLQKFNGYTVTAQALNGEVKIPVSYGITNEEKAAQKTALESFDMDNYFGARWLNEDGSYNSTQLADDKYLLENKDKVFQKFANEVANQTIKWMQQNKSNTKISGTPSGTFSPDTATIKEKQESAIWDA